MQLNCEPCSLSSFGLCSLCGPHKKRISGEIRKTRTPSSGHPIGAKHPTSRGLTWTRRAEDAHLAGEDQKALCMLTYQKNPFLHPRRLNCDDIQKIAPRIAGHISAAGWRDFRNPRFSDQKAIPNVRPGQTKKPFLIMKFTDPRNRNPPDMRYSKPGEA